MDLRFHFFLACNYRVGGGLQENTWGIFVTKKGGSVFAGRGKSTVVYYTETTFFLNKIKSVLVAYSQSLPTFSHLFIAPSFWEQK